MVISVYGMQNRVPTLQHKFLIMDKALNRRKAVSSLYTERRAFGPHHFNPAGKPLPIKEYVLIKSRWTWDL
jgi:hypothetical protein